MKDLLEELLRVMIRNNQLKAMELSQEVVPVARIHYKNRIFPMDRYAYKLVSENCIDVLNLSHDLVTQLTFKTEDECAIFWEHISKGVSVKYTED